MSLSKSEYISILQYYNIDSKKMSMNEVKKTAENILATKMCRCIKKFENNYKNVKESGAFAICRNSIFTKKNIKFFRFSCKKGPKLIAKNKTLKISKI
jgi:hypothetical protein